MLNKGISKDVLAVIMPRNIRRASEVASAVRTSALEKYGDGRLFDEYPIDMRAVVQLGLEIPVVELPNLSLASSNTYLCALRGEAFMQVQTMPDRDLYGLLYVGPPWPVIFMRSRLDSSIANYVLAHEVSHYIADVLLVQKAWLDALPNLHEVIRSALQWETGDPQLELRLLLSSLPNLPRSILERGRQTTAETAEKEILADLVARELIAPWSEITKSMMSLLDSQPGSGVGVLRTILTAELRERFGMPPHVAGFYVDDLCNAYLPRRDYIDRLFGLP